MTTDPTQPLQETNMLLRAIIILLSDRMPPAQRYEFLASVGIEVVASEPKPKPGDNIVEFPAKDAG